MMDFIDTGLHVEKVSYASVDRSQCSGEGER